MRKTIINAVQTILKDSGLFKNIYLSPTNIQKERSFPVAWINLKNEFFNEDSLTSSNFFRNITLEVILGVKQNYGEDNMNSLLDSVFELLERNYTLDGTIINLTPTQIVTDDGFLVPYAIASITYKLLVR